LNEVDNVNGVLLADNNGLCIIARGEADPSYSGLIVSAMSTIQENNEKQVLCIESHMHDILIKKHGEYTLALFKKKDSYDE